MASARRVLPALLAACMALSSLLASPAPVSPLETWRSSACQALFDDKVDRTRKEKTTWVDEAGIFFPSSEAHRQAPAYEHEASTLRRTITYEDVSFPRSWHVNIAGDPNKTANAFRRPFCITFIRTPVRATQATYATCGRKKVLYVHVWKAASTSTRSLLQHHPCRRIRRNCSECVPCTPSLGPCATDTTVLKGQVDYTFSFVRDPWDRFLAGVREHKVWSKQMSRNEAEVKGMAKKLFSSWPHGMTKMTDGPGACEYKTQSYLLSGTDMAGNMLQYDFLGRVEDMQGSLRNLSQFLGVNVLAGEQHQNPSGNLSAVVSARAQKMPFVVCVVCRVFLQDYICFGYPLPERCCKNYCKKFGIQFEQPHLKAARCH